MMRNAMLMTFLLLATTGISAQENTLSRPTLFTGTAASNWLNLPSLVKPEAVVHSIPLSQDYKRYVQHIPLSRSYGHYLGKTSDRKELLTLPGDQRPETIKVFQSVIVER